MLNDNIYMTLKVFAVVKLTFYIDVSKLLFCLFQ